MNRIYIAILWIIIGVIFGGYVYASTFGNDEGFGTAKFGTGTSTTTTYDPGYNRTIIIGGGLVMVLPEDLERTEREILYDKLMLQEETEWEELLH